MWTMHMYLRFRGDEDDHVKANNGRAEALLELGEKLEVDPEWLRWQPALKLCERYDEGVLGFDRDDVVSTWRDANALVDAGTESPETACPHEAVTEDRCLFHLDPAKKDDEVVRDAVLEKLRSNDPDDRKLDGARFGDLDLSNRTLGSDLVSPIDLRFAVVEGDLNMEKVSVTRSMFSMRFARVCGDAIFRSADFGSTATFVGTQFDGNVTFYRARFGSKARFVRTRFGRSRHSDGASRASRSGGGYTTFGKATFDWTANFYESTFNGAANFDRACFEGPAVFRRTRFADGGRFRRATFAGPLESIAVEAPDGLDWYRAVIEWGQLVQSTPAVQYDLTRATIGDLTLEGPPETRPLFDHLRIHQTDFDGFDFSAHREELQARSWEVHTSGSEEGRLQRLGRRLGLWGSLVTGDRSPEPIESTYLRAKNAAAAAGHSVAEAEFFRKEMAYRRVGHGRQFRTDRGVGRLVGGWRWTANFLMALTTGYGERPSRVLLSSLAIVVGFALCYAAVLGSLSTPWEIQEYLLFSFQSFISFIVGPPPFPGDESFALRLASAIEGFVGAFFVALFVFTLTRSIHR